MALSIGDKKTNYRPEGGVSFQTGEEEIAQSANAYVNKVLDPASRIGA